MWVNTNQTNSFIRKTTTSVLADLNMHAAADNSGPFVVRAIINILAFFFYKVKDLHFFMQAVLKNGHHGRQPWELAIRHIMTWKFN